MKLPLKDLAHGLISIAVIVPLAVLQLALLAVFGGAEIEREP